MPSIQNPPQCPPSRPFSVGRHTRAWALCVPALLAAWAGPAGAEKADRALDMTILSSPCVVDLAKNTYVCTGNVVITQGTLTLKADRIEVRETPDGYRTAQAIGSAAKPAQYREKRDGVNEFIEGSALRIDYDSRAATVRLDGQAVARRLRGTVVADEMNGRQIVWNANTDQLSVDDGAPTAANPGGRVRTVISAKPALAASAPAAAPTPPPPPLRSSGALGERK